MLNLRRIFKRKKPDLPPVQKVMTFGELVSALDAFKENLVASGKSESRAAKQAVSELEAWIRGNWGEKKTVLIPFWVQEVYDRAVVNTLDLNINH